MSISWADVLVVAPELSSVATGTQIALIAMADRQIDDDQWLDLADDGRKFLTAHLATLSNAAGSGVAAAAVGPVTSETLGPMSRTYGSADSSGNSRADPLLATTKYGLYYLHLVRLLPSSIGFVP